MRLVIYLAVVLLAPMVVLRLNNGEVVDTTMMLTSSVGLALLLFAVWSLLGRRAPRVAGLVTALLALAAFIVRASLAFLYDFSGRGFGSELFLHVNATSFLVAWGQYGDEIIVAVVLAVLLGVAGTWLARREPGATGIGAAATGAIGATLVLAGAAAAPEWLLARAWYRYAFAGGEVAVSSEKARAAALAELEPIRGAAMPPVTRSRIVASPPARPINLVLVYLESFNEMLTENRRYPDLTPRINELKSRLTVYSPVYSSAYLTIEGIANSQCGTLMDMEHANNSLITREGRLSLLPCLGDVLRAAGYHQVYLGGANLDFAGKGEFLREHGYDRVLGFEHWEKLGFEAVAHWGISDVELFDQAVETIDELRRGTRPFNVTLLTLGTHLPGFTYEGCPAYPDGEGDPFLDAVHCTDHLFGTFVDELERRGVFEDTMLVAQADHGVFENPDMRELFGDGVDDRRLLTLVRFADGMDAIGADAGDDASVNLAPTLLDLLGIEHNVTFLLGRSRLDPPATTAYFMTRRTDYHESRAIANDAARCEAPDAARLIDVPLDDCDKHRAMQALQTLNLGYVRADDGANTNQVCDLAAAVDVDAGTGRVAVKWGSEQLTHWFYHRGTRVRDTAAAGVYAVMLDEYDNVRRAVFFGADNDYDLWRLSELAGHESNGGRLLLVSNVDAAAVPEAFRHLWPSALDTARVLYGQVVDGELVPEKVFDAPSGHYRFNPASCGDG